MQVIRKYVWILYITAISLSTTLLLGVVTGLKCIAYQYFFELNKYCNVVKFAIENLQMLLLLVLLYHTVPVSTVPVHLVKYSTF